MKKIIKITSIFVVCILLFTLTAGCFGSNNGSVNVSNNRDGSITYSNDNVTVNVNSTKDPGWDVVKSLLNEKGYNDWTWNDEIDWHIDNYKAYSLTISKGSESYALLVYMTDDYSVFMASISGDNIQFLVSRQDFIDDYNDWINGNRETKPNVSDYPDQSDLMNGYLNQIE